MTAEMVDAGLVPQAVVEYRWQTDRGTANACVDRFEAYRHAVEMRDAALRGDVEE